MRILTGMKDKKAAKLILKRAKEHPDLYTKQDVRYAKMVKRRIKLEKKHNESSQTDIGDT